MEDGSPAVRMQGIAKAFGPVQALRGADFTLAPGEIHALLGENGAGKTTLMHVLFGLVSADAGVVEVFGTPLAGGDPRRAMAMGIGLVHQHFSQVPRMTVAENVSLGRGGFRFDRRTAAASVVNTGRATGLELDPAALAGSLPVGLRQRLEIVKALAHDARILLLDEPTASLTPREIDELFASLRRLTALGISVVLITHKLREVAMIADRVTVLRQGSVVLTGAAADYTAEQLATAMVGESITGTPGRHPSAGPTGAVLEVRNVFGASFEIRAGEIVGIAAVEGNGQRELLRAVAGLVPHHGAIAIPSGRPGFVPEDRHAEGLVLDFSVAENLALGSRGGWLLDRRGDDARAVRAAESLGIRMRDPRQPVRALSGGNQQKVVLARVLEEAPSLLIAENPTRGLDLKATADVHAALRRAAHENGAGVLFYSTDLDEVLALADRVAVMSSGRWLWVAEADRTRERVGALMLGAAA